MEKVDMDKLQVGQIMIDASGAVCVYLGYAKEHVEYDLKGHVQLVNESYTVVDIVCAPARVYAMFYNNTWSLQKIKAGEFFFVPNGSESNLLSRISAGFVQKGDWRLTD